MKKVFVVLFILTCAFSSVCSAKDVPDFSSEEAVKDAIVDAIKKYVEETPEEIRKKIGYYHTNGCCWGNLRQRWEKFCRPSL